MELGFLLSLTGLLSGLWLYLYATITDRSVANPSDPTLLVLGVVHVVVLAYLVMALYLFYYKGIGSPTSDKAKRWLEVTNGLLLETWPVALIGLVVSFLTSKVSSSDFGMKISILLLAVIVLLISAYQSFRRPVDSKIDFGHKMKFFVGLLIGAMPYMLLMGFFLADVQITTDKPVYMADDAVTVTVRRAGYIFLPELRKLSFGLYEKDSGIEDFASIVTAQQYGHDNLIRVEYEPQGLSFRRVAYHPVLYAKTQ